MAARSDRLVEAGFFGRAVAHEVHSIQADLGLRGAQGGVGGDDARTGLNQLLAGFHGAHQGVLTDAGSQIGFLGGHRHHGGELGHSRHSGIDGGFSGEQLLSNFVRGETTFFQHSTILFEKRTGG